MHSDLERYVKACDFPGQLDETAVEKHLKKYLKALGVRRKIVRLRSGWTLEEYPALEKYAHGFLDELTPHLYQGDSHVDYAVRDAIGIRAVRALHPLQEALATLGRQEAEEVLTVIAEVVAINYEDGFVGGPFGDITSLLVEEARTALTNVGAAIFTPEKLESIADRAVRDGNRRACDLGEMYFVRRAHAHPLILAFLENLAILSLGSSVWIDRTANSTTAAIRARQESDAFVAINAAGSLHVRGEFGLRDALLARANRNDRDLLRRFTAWCIHDKSSTVDDLSDTALCWLVGRTERTVAWSRPIFEAYIAGAWILHWTDNTLYWVAKPRLHIDRSLEAPWGLHRDDGPAVESDVESLYYLRGVRVPEDVVTHWDEITLDHIQREENAEVRRVMIERYGPSRYLLDSNAEIIHQDDFGTLYRARLEGDEPLVMVRVVNPTPEPDGSRKEYFIRVPPTMKRARQAVAWTFGQKEKGYKPEVQT